MDLAEVELVDTYLDEPRGNDSQLLAVSLKNKSLIHMKTRQNSSKCMNHFVTPRFHEKVCLRVNISLIFPFPLTETPSRTPRTFSREIAANIIIKENRTVSYKVHDW